MYISITFNIYIEFVVCNDAYFLVSSSGYCCGAVPNHSRSSLRSSCGAAAKLLRSRCDVVLKLSRSRLRSSGDASTKPSRNRHESVTKPLLGCCEIVPTLLQYGAVAKLLRGRSKCCEAVAALSRGCETVLMPLRCCCEAVTRLLKRWSRNREACSVAVPMRRCSVMYAKP